MNCRPDQTMTAMLTMALAELGEYHGKRAITVSVAIDGMPMPRRNKPCRRKGKPKHKRGIKRKATQ